ncbi:MAG: hypothetical protein K2K93_00050, partial [Muribaculaceae bacterium]|nr:hypothetical protein [Muribaculaceae bacterium]
ADYLSENIFWCHLSLIAAMGATPPGIWAIVLLILPNEKFLLNLQSEKTKMPVKYASSAL